MKHKPETILDAAVRLFADEGVGVSTAKVAKAAGVSNGTLFNYFPSKQHLLDALYVALKVELAAAIGDDPGGDSLRERVQVIWDRWIDWAIAHRDRHDVLGLLKSADLVSAEAVARADEAFVTSAAVFHEAVETGLFVDMPFEFVSAFVQTQLELVVVAGLTDVERDRAFAMVWNGITISHLPQEATT
ncbi:MAG: TetR/AcrR family transcriptional regulator [Actinomycetota bacterium]